MIKYDYLIDRNLGQGKSRRFYPNQIPTKLENVVVIEGPNSSGKSTLLNIIALGFFGRKSSRINPILKSKLDSLLDLDHQKIRFSVKIVSNNNKLALKSEKVDINGNEIIVEESIDGKRFKPLSFETFQRKYNLIYDIPSNPTERLPDLLKELRDEQLQFGSGFKDFGIYLRNVITEINASRNPKRLKELRTKLVEEEKKKEKLEKDLPELEAFLNKLEMNAYVEYFYRYSNEGLWLTRKVDKLQKEVDKIKRDGKKITKSITKNRKRLERLQREFSEDYKKITPLMQNIIPRNERSRFKIWKDINPYHIERNELNTVKIEATYFKNVFSKEIDLLKKDKSFTEAKIMEQLFDALSEFEDSMLKIPELEVTIGELVRILRKECNTSSILIKKHDTLEKIIDDLENLKKIVEELKKTEGALELETEVSEDLCEDIDDYAEKNRQLISMKNDLKSLALKCNDYLQRCVSKGIDPQRLESMVYKDFIKEIPRDSRTDQYLSLSEEQVLEQIKNLQDEIVDKRGELSGLEVVIKAHRKDVKHLEDQKSHKFEKYVDVIGDLLRKTDAISQKILSNYTLNLKKLMTKKIKVEQELKKEELRYYDEVSKYLAHRIGFFRHIDKIYRAKVVDLISRKIITESEEIIYIGDFGTGEGQSAYILSLLNIKDDNRKIIALFDEIAMMDDKSLKPIYSRLRELYESDQLLLGIMVQRSNDLTVKELI